MLNQPELSAIIQIYKENNNCLSNMRKNLAIIDIFRLKIFPSRLLLLGYAANLITKNIFLYFIFQNVDSKIGDARLLFGTTASSGFSVGQVYSVGFILSGIIIHNKSFWALNRMQFLILGSIKYFFNIMHM